MIAAPPRFRYAQTGSHIASGDIMADHKPAGPLETGAPMDYAEHERTYSAFLSLTKYGVILCTALMAANLARLREGERKDLVRETDALLDRLDRV